MAKNINPDIKKVLSERIAKEQKLNEKSKLGYDAKRKTQALVAGTLIATTIGSTITPTFADSRYELSEYKGIGYISVTEEVGPNGNGAMISSGKGDAGGVSYGLTQLSTKMGSADKFVDEYLKENYPDFYKFFENADKAGTESFNEAWTNAYNHNPGEFERIQLENKEVNYINPSYNKVKNKFGIDLLSSRARIEFLHSTSVQFGPDGVVELFENSGVTKEMDDEELLSKLSDEKYKSVGTYKFMNCDSDTQDSVRQRFLREKEEYLKIVEEEKGPLLEDEIDVSMIETEYSEEEFIETAKSYLNQGTTYKMGGKNTDKLDCSGYVSLVYQDMGIDIDKMMTNAGKFRNDSTQISRDELQTGDLVFWHDKTGTKHAKVFHIGIYIGDDTVIDCSIDHNGVGTRKLSSLQDNKNRYYTFGRYEALQEKINPTVPDIYLDLSASSEFEGEIEVSDSIEEKYQDEDTNKDNLDTDINEDESIIDEEVIDTEIEDEPVIDEEVIDTEIEDESIIDEEVIKEDIIEKDETIIDNESIKEEPVVDEDSVDSEIDEDEPVIDEGITDIEEDESIVDEEVIDENKNTEEDNSTIDKEVINNDNKEENIIPNADKSDNSSEPIIDNKEINDNLEEDKSLIDETNVENNVQDDFTTENSKENTDEDTSNNKEDTNSDKEEKSEVNDSLNDNTEVEAESVVAMSESELKIQRLEKKLENNIFNNLFKF